MQGLALSSQRCAAAPRRASGAAQAPASRVLRASRAAQPRRSRATPARAGLLDDELIVPGRQSDGVLLPAFPRVYAAGGGGGGNSNPGAGAANAATYSEHKPKTPPPDLPSLLLDSRIVYLGMPLVPAVTELIVAELLYMQYTDGKKPVYLYINSTGCTRADGETVGFETEATAIYDTMNYIANPVYTVGIGVAIGQACMLLSAGEKGHRYMMPHATAMLHQPRVPSTGQRQAIELYIKWREVLSQKQATLDILHKTTGRSHAQLDADTARPLYMQPADALEYGVIDKVMKETVKGAKGGNPDAIVDAVKSADKWDSEAGLVARPARPGA